MRRLLLVCLMLLLPLHGSWAGVARLCGSGGCPSQVEAEVSEFWQELRSLQAQHAHEHAGDHLHDHAHGAMLADASAQPVQPALEAVDAGPGEDGNLKRCNGECSHCQAHSLPGLLGRSAEAAQAQAERGISSYSRTWRERLAEVLLRPPAQHRMLQA